MLGKKVDQMVKIYISFTKKHANTVFFTR
ncbi:hypothetical protein G057_12784 [Klebsiella pneumoniae hvKP1]|nr:hypothetical protein D364_00140 [Klebsiella pneumoniae CG43]EMB10532.1 hypothetical protein G057_12784 [Klebsiella pneumoniae hvKP1]ERN56451.1 hypothetical protein N598_01590 [Klebsiella pneumoniae 303K]